MKARSTKSSYAPGSLRGARSPHTLLLRMAADQERAQRIAALKAARPDLTWKRIAEHVGVTERAAVEWQRTGGIDYENVPALAALFEVDRDYIWRGPHEEDTPNLLEVTARAEQLDDVTATFLKRVNEIEARQKHLVEMVEARVEHDERVQELLDKQNALLAGQTKLLDQLDRLVKRLVAAGVPAPPGDLGRRRAGVKPIPPTGVPERRRAAGGSQPDSA